LDSDVDFDGEGLYPAGELNRLSMQFNSMIYIFLKNIEYIEGDEFCINCRVSLSIDNGNGDIGLKGFASVPGDALQDTRVEVPGRYCVIWHR
jgi:hypothetical protein